MCGGVGCKNPFYNYDDSKQGTASGCPQSPLGSCLSLLEFTRGQSAREKGGLLLATLPRHCYTFHYEFSSSKACRNNAQLLRPRRIFQFSCSNSCHIDVLSAACCQLSVVSPLCLSLPSLCPLCLGVWSDACCRLEGVVGNGMSVVNIYAAQCSYRVGKGDDVSFLTAAEFVACLQS